MASAHEPPPVGHHRTRIGQSGLALQTAYQLGYARGGKPKEPDVILTEVGPTRVGIGEGMEDAGTEPGGGPEVVLEPDHLHRGLEGCIVETSLAVHHDDDSARRETLVFEQAADNVAGQAGPPVGQDHCSDAEGSKISSSIRHGGNPRNLVVSELRRLPRTFPPNRFTFTTEWERGK